MDYSSNSNDSSLITSKHILIKYADENNLYDKLDQSEIFKIAGNLLKGLDDDKQSQAKWLSDTEDCLKLAKLTKEPKNTPLPQSANIKYPLITTSAYQFAARTYPEIIQDGKIVKTEIIGQSNPLIDMMAYGVTTHMSYQLLGADSEWEKGLDKLLVVLPIIGCVFKKTYHDSITDKNCSEVCYYKDIVLRNSENIQSMNDLRRVTHILHIHPNDLIEGCRSGIFDEDCVKEIINFYSESTTNPECDLYEQHCFLDLDDDGYEEPYIVTMHKQTQKIIRIYARYTKDDIKFNSHKEVITITPIQYFTDYHFLPAPDGSFLSWGFGTFLLHSNEMANTILNQLIDAGTLSNLQIGFIDSRIKIMGGQMMAEPGQWTKVKSVVGQNIKDGFFPLNYKEPSTVLYQLLGLILQASKELTSSTDAMQGLQNATNVPATSMLAMIEQGMKMFSSIQRRLYRGLKDEYHKLYRLNGIYLDEKEYLDLLGPLYQQLPNIYQSKSLKILPIADPNLSSDAQRMVQSQALMALAGRPGINTAEIYKRYLESLKITNIESIVSPQAAQATNAPDPKTLDVHAKIQAKQAEVQIKSRAQDLKEKEFIAKLSKIEAEITQMQANSVKMVSQAQAEQTHASVSDFNSKLEAMKTQIQSVAQAHAQLTQNHIANKQLAQQQQVIDNKKQQGAMELQHKQNELQSKLAGDQESNDSTNGSDNQRNDNSMDQATNNSGNAEDNSGNS